MVTRGSGVEIRAGRTITGAKGKAASYVFSPGETSQLTTKPYADTHPYGRIQLAKTSMIVGGRLLWA